MKTIREKIEEIIDNNFPDEMDLSMKHPNASEALDAIRKAVLTALPEKKKCKDYYGKPHDTFKTDGAILHAHEVGFNACLDTIKERLEKV